ncbi:hypothetical protein HDU96_004247, partial [Phlyctochytrium bullatum]
MSCYRPRYSDRYDFRRAPRSRAVAPAPPPRRSGGTKFSTNSDRDAPRRTDRSRLAGESASSTTSVRSSVVVVHERQRASTVMENGPAAAATTAVVLREQDRGQVALSACANLSQQDLAVGVYARTEGYLAWEEEWEDAVAAFEEETYAIRPLVLPPTPDEDDEDELDVFEMAVAAFEEERFSIAPLFTLGPLVPAPVVPEVIPASIPLAVPTPFLAIEWHKEREVCCAYPNSEAHGPVLSIEWPKEREVCCAYPNSEAYAAWEEAFEDAVAAFEAECFAIKDHGIPLIAPPAEPPLIQRE